VSDFILFIIVLGTLIIGHELGHFFAAKICGVRVEEFGIGYPPRLATLFTAGGTKFTINWIPFGGFNLPAGENDPEVEGGLAGSSKRVRTAVLLAGPAANILIAFTAFLLANKFVAPDFERVLIIEVVQGTPAEEAGVLPGDIVLNVGEEQITTTESMVDAIRSRVGTLTQIGFDRDGNVVSVELIPRTQYPSGQGPIGVTLGHPAKTTNWLEAAKLSVDSISYQVNALFRLPGRLLSGVATPEETRVTGLKGIHDMIAWAVSIDRSTQRPFLTITLIGIISTGLALANLLPFPALDGGRMMFVLIELIFRRRVAPRYEGLAHAIGFTLLLAFMIYINFQDFINPIALPR